MKLRCDGENPCSSCIKRNLKCNNQSKKQNQAKGSDPGKGSCIVFFFLFWIGLLNCTDRFIHLGSSPTKLEDYDPASDRGSIKFLLNAGTDSFTEKFHLPPRGDRTRGVVYHNQKELEQTMNHAIPYTLDGSRQPEYVSTFVEPDPAGMSFFQDTFVNFFNGPFSDAHKTLQDPFVGGLAYQAIVPSGQDPELSVPGNHSFYEPESPFATALVQSILAKAWTVNLDPKAQEEISADLQYLLTTKRIRKFINMYFRYWHPNCLIIHPPSFDPEHVPLSLLASVVFMGAMYSDDERETYAAKRVLDFAELFVFSTETFSCELEVSRVFNGLTTPDSERDDWLHFQNFQAGYLMVVIQYWAGSRVSRNRAMENRFSEIIKVLTPNL